MVAAGHVQAALCAFLRDADAVSSALSDAEDPAAFAAQMLRSNDDDADTSDAGATVSAMVIVTSFPRASSFVDQLAVFITAWATYMRCPLEDQSPAAEGVSVLTTSRDQVIGLPLGTVRDFVGVCTPSAGEEEETATCHHLIIQTAAFIQALGGARGVLTCLGFRETVGSRTVAPLTRAQCLTSFQRLQSSKERLTVGARAFTKHCARSSSGFWGEFKGTDLTKNATALAKVEYILDSAVWKNVHSLPHGEATFELRDAQGYGARWYIRDQSFRGFLEPHMENGHENRWRH